MLRRERWETRVMGKRIKGKEGVQGDFWGLVFWFDCDFLVENYNLVAPLSSNQS